MFRKSPLNYVGGKYKLIGELKKILPASIGKFVDLFCGGLNVTINVEAKTYIANDICRHTIDFYKFLQDNSEHEILHALEHVVATYGLSKTNQDGFLALRNDFNTESHPIKFMALVSNSFNHQIRFNSKGEFNMPFGRHRSHYNDKMKANLISLIRFIKEKNIQFTCADFRECELSPECFLYCDPPYRLSTAVYNTGWGEREDGDLLSLLDRFNDSGGRFALSCSLSHNGQENDMIKTWSQSYVVYFLKWTYGNSNYHKKDRKEGQEACITNLFDKPVD